MINQIKQRWLPALLCAFILAFTVLVFGPIDIYVGNRVEFTFTVSDFILQMSLIALAITAVLFGVFLILPKKVYPAIVGFFSGTAIMSVVQSMFLNKGTSALPSGDMADRIGIPMLIIDTIVWVIVIAGCIFAAYNLKKFDIIKTISLIMALVVFGMTAVGAVSDILTAAQPIEAETADNADGEDETEYGIRYLSTRGIREVAPKNNIIVFILDRFDIKYYDRVNNNEEDFFEPLEGFTYFSDNISYFSATYPSISHLITGEKQDFSKNANDFFSDAYNNSDFLKDLSENDYSIRLYTGSYYAYRDCTNMPDYIENSALTGHYIVVNRSALLYQMTILSLYRYAPSLAKTFFPEKWFSFESVSDVEDNGESVYNLDDADFYQTMTEGLTLQESQHENAYIFYHFNGCHYPVAMNENCERDEDASVKEATMGCFKIIYNYIDELKRLGLYDDATIVITGDHSAGFCDEEGAAPVNGTALLVKPAKSSGKLKASSAQVCDDNLIPTLVKASNIQTEHDYGKGYFDIAEGVNVERFMARFQSGENGGTDCIFYTVKGPWVDKNNWVETGKTNYSDFYR